MLGKNVKVTGKVKKLYFQKVFIFFKTIQSIKMNLMKIFILSFIYLAKIKSSKADYFIGTLTIIIRKKSGFSSIIFLK